MPNALLTSLATARGEVEVRLGSSALDVELASTDVDQAIKEAVRTYNGYRPGVMRKKLNFASGKRRYEINEPGIMGISDVQFILTRPHRTVEGRDPFYLDYSRYGGGAQTAMWGEWEYLAHHYEQSRVVSSSDSEWFWQWEYVDDGQGGKHDVPVLYIDAPLNPDLVGYEFTYGYDTDTSTDAGMNRIKEQDAQDVLDFAVARAKQTLGRIRGKFTGITGPTGQVEQVDYQELLREGQEDEQRIRERWETKRRPLPPVIG